MLYRNNFRVMPFGEPGDDWLGLDRRKGQGRSRFLASRELVGHISISDDKRFFEEVSSRSGGIKNQDAQEELENFVREKILKRLEKYVVGVIRWDSPRIRVKAESKGARLLDVVTSLAGGREGVLQINPGPEAYAVIKEAGFANAETIIQNLKSISGGAVEGEGRQFLEKNVSALRSVVAQVKREMANKEKQILFLEKSEARRGELVSMMQHAFSIVNDAAVPAIKAAINQAVELDLPQPFLQKLAAIKEAVQKLMILSQLASTAKFDLGKEQVSADLVPYTVQYLKSHWAESLKQWGIKLHFVKEEISYEKRTDLLAYSLVIDNFVDNARKAKATNLYVQFVSHDGRLEVMFSDDGAGVSRGAVARLFVPGFSTTGGTGLGLYSVKRILEELGGSVEFVGNGVEGLGKGACFQVTL
jgi:signal transduction histidine kinase